MIGIISDILLLLLVSASFPAGYFIGTYTESEIEKTAEALKIDRFFNVILIVAEILVLVWLSTVSNGIYFLAAAVVLITNLVLCSLYTAIKADLVKIVGYEVLFIAVSLVLSSIVLLI